MSIGQVIAGAIAGKMQYDQTKYYKEQDKKRDELSERILNLTAGLKKTTQEPNTPNATEVVQSDGSTKTTTSGGTTTTFDEGAMPETKVAILSDDELRKSAGKQPRPNNINSTYMKMAEGGIVGYMHGGTIGYYHGGMGGVSDRFSWQKENFKK